MPVSMVRACFTRALSLTSRLRRLRWTLPLALATLTAPTLAVECTGLVSTLSLQANTGTVVYSLDQGPYWIYLCNFNGDTAGVTVPTCKGIYATMVAAKLAQKKVLFRYPGYSTCASVPAWAYPTGGHDWDILLID